MEHRHQESGLIIILRQMSLSLLLLLAIWALLCPMAHLSAVLTGVGVDLLHLLRRSLAAALAITTTAGGGFLGLLHPDSPLLYQQQLAAILR